MQAIGNNTAIPAQSTLARQINRSKAESQPAQAQTVAATKTTPPQFCMTDDLKYLYANCYKPTIHHEVTFDDTQTAPKPVPQVCPEQVAALYEKQNTLRYVRASVWNAMSPEQREGLKPLPTSITEPQILSFLSMSIEDRIQQARQHEANAEAYALSGKFPQANTSLRWYDGRNMSHSEAKARMDNAIMVYIGRDELPKLMEEIEKALANGESYLSVIEKFFDANEGGAPHDKIFIDPFMGTVKHAMPSGFAYHVEAERVLHSTYDDDAVWDLAYDLQKFLQLRVFGETNGLDESEVERIIASIKESQANKNTWRFHGGNV